MVSHRITLKKHQNYCEKSSKKLDLAKKKIVYVSLLASNSISEEIKFEAPTPRPSSGT
jgi:hypothetical protein